MQWPEMHAVTPREMLQLLERVAAVDLARACQVAAETVEAWKKAGVPDGPHAALLRQIARLNGISLIAQDSQRCLLCPRPAAYSLRSSRVCSDCAQHPRRAARAHRFDTKEGENEYGLPWFAVVGPSFEFPVTATLSRQGWRPFGSRDPEVGDDDFDDSIHIETDDYEALFDTFQHQRRRELAKDIAESTTLELNVNQLICVMPVSFPRDSQEARTRIELFVVLLAWSLANEKARTLF